MKRSIARRRSLARRPAGTGRCGRGERHRRAERNLARERGEPGEQHRTDDRAQPDRPRARGRRRRARLQARLQGGRRRARDRRHRRAAREPGRPERPPEHRLAAVRLGLSAVSAPLEIRSFRSVFALERRIYRIDTLRLNPVGDAAARHRLRGSRSSLVGAVAGALPPTRWLDPLVPWYVRDLGLPLAAAWLLGLGSHRRPPVPPRRARCAAHVAGAADGSARCAAGARRARAGARRRSSASRTDRTPAFARCATAARARCSSRRPHLRAEWSRAPRRADVTLHPLAGPAGGRTTVLELAAGAVLEVRPR